MKRLLPALLVIVLAACGGRPSATRSQVGINWFGRRLAYQVFQDSVLAKGYSDLVKTKVADAMESDFYWINSVDRTTYDPDKNRFTLDISVDFEDVYRDDPNEWKTDTWEFYTTYARDMWGQFVEGFLSNPDVFAGVTFDWPRWTPGITLIANGGSLSVACPGAFIDRLRQRDASQSDYVKDCALKPKA